MLTATLTHTSSLVTLLASATYYFVVLQNIDTGCSNPRDMQEPRLFSLLVIRSQQVCIYDTFTQFQYTYSIATVSFRCFPPPPPVLWSEDKRHLFHSRDLMFQESKKCVLLMLKNLLQQCEVIATAVSVNTNCTSKTKDI